MGPSSSGSSTRFCSASRAAIACAPRRVGAPHRAQHRPVDQPGVGPARAQAVDRDAVLGDLRRERARVADQPVLRRGVGEPAAAALGVARADVDDAPVPAIAHMREHRVGGAERRHQIEAQVVEEELIVVTDRLEAGEASRPHHDAARVVDQDVEAAEGIEDRARRGVGLLEVERVGGDRETAAAGRFDLARHRLELVARSRAHRDHRAFARHRQRDRASDAASTAGDPGRSSVEASHRDLLLWQGGDATSELGF